MRVVRGEEVETVKEIVVGEGRKMWRLGAVSSIGGFLNVGS